MKCQICNVELNSKTMGIYEHLSRGEKKRLKKLRKNRGYCSECAINMIILNC